MGPAVARFGASPLACRLLAARVAALHRSVATGRAGLQLEVGGRYPPSPGLHLERLVRVALVLLL